MSTTRAASRDAAVATKAPSAALQDKRPAAAKIGPESALVAAVKNRGVLGLGGMLALQAAAGNRAVMGLVQAKRERSSSSEAPPIVQDALGSASRPLDPRVRTQMESRMSQDFGQVRIHDGALAASAASAASARAYTVGNDIVFGKGEYQPGSADGQRLLAHELTHVVQQGDGTRAYRQKTNGEDASTGDASARLLSLIRFLEQLAEQWSPGSSPEAVAELEKLNRGIQDLRAIAARPGDAAKEQAVSLLTEQLTHGGVPVHGGGGGGGATGGPKGQLVAPPEVEEQRPPEVAKQGLEISTPSDPAEVEAERVADAVVTGAPVTIAKTAPRSVHRVETGMVVSIGIGLIVVAATAAIALWRRAKPQRDADARARALDDEEHALYEQFETIKADGSQRVERRKILDRLDEIQAEHVRLMTYVHVNNLQLWTPDRNNLSPAEKKRLQDAWSELRNGRGMIGHANTEGKDEAEQDLRSMNARLLSRPKGRQLLYALLDKNEGEKRDAVKGVTIKSTPKDDSTKEDRDAMRQRKRYFEEVIYPRNLAQETKVGELAQELQAFASLKGQETPEELEKLEEVQREGELLQEYQEEERRYKSQDKTYRISIPDPAVADAKGLGAGSGANIDIRRGVKDSEQLSVDESGNYIPSPAFLQYGHELIHALHYKQGNKDQLHNGAMGTDYQETGTFEKYDNPEEHHTIETLEEGAISENALRAEHKISERKWHRGKHRDEVESMGLI